MNIRMITGFSKFIEFDANQLSVEYIKNRIFDELNIPVKEQKLIVCGSYIKDDTDRETLFEYITKNPCIHLIHMKYNYHVQNVHDGQTFDIRLSISDSHTNNENFIETLQKYLFNYHSYDPLDYDIYLYNRKDDKLYINAKKINAVLILKNNEIDIKLKFNSYDDYQNCTVENLKKYIREKFNINYQRQIVFVNNNICDNNHKLKYDDDIIIYDIPQRNTYYARMITGKELFVDSGNPSLSVSALLERFKLSHETHYIVLEGKKLEPHDHVTPLDKLFIIKYIK